MFLFLSLSLNKVTAMRADFVSFLVLEENKEVKMAAEDHQVEKSSLNIQVVTHTDD